MMDDVDAEIVLSEPLITGDGEKQNVSLRSRNGQGRSAESECDLSSDIEVIEVQQQNYFDDNDVIEEVGQLFGSPYAKTCSFWRKSLACVVLGFMVGCAVAAFFTSLQALHISPLLINNNNRELTDGIGYLESKGRDFDVVVLSPKNFIHCSVDD
jgi:hypothetical protein